MMAHRFVVGLTKKFDLRSCSHAIEFLRTPSSSCNDIDIKRIDLISF